METMLRIAVFAHAAAAATIELPTVTLTNTGIPIFAVDVPDKSQVPYIGISLPISGYTAVLTQRVEQFNPMTVTTVGYSVRGYFISSLAVDTDTTSFTFKHNHSSPTFVSVATATSHNIFAAGPGDYAGIALWGAYVYVASASVWVSEKQLPYTRWQVDVGCTAIDIAVAEDGILGVVCVNDVIIFDIKANQTHPEEIYRRNSGAQTNVAGAAMDGLFVVASAVGTQTEVAVFSPSEDPPLRNTFVLPPASCGLLKRITVAEINMNKTVFLSCWETGIQALYIEHVNASNPDEYMAGYWAGGPSSDTAVAGDFLVSVDGYRFATIDVGVLGYHGGKSSGSRPALATTFIAFAVVASSLLW
ncbi:hypothetical protein DIPPA_00733 [Diplonema papillatum]|nr:hypothetical protein DIPPA_00733 [Diplonema papillatum]